jgi:hypothetical protein
MFSKTEIINNQYYFHGTKEDFISNGLPPEFMDVFVFNYASYNKTMKSNSSKMFKNIDYAKEFEKWRNQYYESLQEENNVLN